MPDAIRAFAPSLPPRPMAMDGRDDLRRLLGGVVRSATDPGELRRVPRFFPFEALSGDEQRILACSFVRGRSGRALYAKLAQDDPRQLANFLNQTAALARAGLLPYVQAVEGFEDDRIRAVVDGNMVRAVQARRGAFVGPEDSRKEHGRYDVAFRENVPYASQQLSFASASGYTRVEIDLDEECPTCGDAQAALEHLARVGRHKLGRKLPGLPGNATDAYAMGERLRQQRGITPRYQLVGR